MLLCGVSRGQLFGPPTQQTLQEFLGHPVGYRGYGAEQPVGYGTPKPFLPVIRKVVSGGDSSSENGGTLGRSPEIEDALGKSQGEFRPDGKAAEHVDRAKDGEASGRDYESLKQAAIKSFSKNAYGLKQNPKKFRNPSRGKLEKFSDDTKRHPEESSDSLNVVSDKSSDFFSHPDWSQAGKEKSRDTNNDQKDGFQPAGFFNEGHTVDGDRSSFDFGGRSESVKLRQNSNSRDHHNSQPEFSLTLNVGSSKSRGSALDGYSEQGDSSSSREQHGSAGDFTDFWEDFGLPKISKNLGIFPHIEDAMNSMTISTSKSLQIFLKNIPVLMTLVRRNLNQHREISARVTSLMPLVLAVSQTATLDQTPPPTPASGRRQTDLRTAGESETSSSSSHSVPLSVTGRVTTLQNRTDHPSPPPRRRTPALSPWHGRRTCRSTAWTTVWGAAWSTAWRTVE